MLWTLEHLLVPPISLGFEVGVRNEAQSGRVDAVPQAALLWWTIVEDVAEMAVAVARANLGAYHPVARIDLLHHVGGFQWDGEAGPPASTFEFLCGGEQRLSRDNVYVDSR